MVQLNIEFFMLSGKTYEFMLSWEQFKLNMNETKGLSECDLVSLDDNHFEIVMSWLHQADLDLFLTSKWYNFLLGALDILTLKIKMQIKPLHN